MKKILTAIALCLICALSYSQTTNDRIYREATVYTIAENGDIVFKEGAFDCSLYHRDLSLVLKGEKFNYDSSSYNLEEGTLLCFVEMKTDENVVNSWTIVLKEVIEGNNQIFMTVPSNASNETIEFFTTQRGYIMFTLFGKGHVTMTFMVSCDKNILNL